MASDILWTATGTVSSVVGAGFPTTAGAAVSVKYSYSKNAIPHVVTRVSGLYSKIQYYGPVELSMEVSIGGQTWSASLPDSPGEALYVEANDGFNITDTFRTTALSTNTATFPSFPHTGTATPRSIILTLRDTHNPSLFLFPEAYPDENAAVGSITDGTGSVKSGSDTINFTIDPLSVRVSKNEPKIPLKFIRTLSGFELRWPSDANLVYRIDEGDRPGQWETYAVLPGTGSEMVVTINPFNDHPKRRFYRVVSE